MNDIEKHCSCHLTGDDPDCVLHGEIVQFAGVPDIQELFGTRIMPNMPVAAPITGRIIDGGHVTLRPYTPKEPVACASELPWFDPRPRTAGTTLDTCSCDLPAIHGYDADCALRPPGLVQGPATSTLAPPAALAMLAAAAQLISDQPTTEQWNTIKKAIRDLVPSP